MGEREKRSGAPTDARERERERERDGKGEGKRTVEVLAVELESGSPFFSTAFFLLSFLVVWFFSFLEE